MAFTVIYDACVLFPAPLRALFIRLGLVGIVRARWSEAILDECFRSILEQRPELNARQLARTRELMQRAIPDSMLPATVGGPWLRRALHFLRARPASAIRRVSAFVRS